MQLRYGKYAHAQNEVAIKVRRLEGIFSENGMQRSVRHHWEVEGMLFATNAVTLSAAMTAMLAAYSLNGQDVGFYDNNNNLTDLFIKNAQTIGGVKVVQKPSFTAPQDVATGGAYTTYVNYNLVIEAELPDTTIMLLSWDEVLNFIGGGQEVKWITLRNGPPQQQVVSQQTTYRATQSGRAVGNFGYPAFPQPRWPNYMLTTQSSTKLGLPTRIGMTGGLLYSEYPIEWNYEFEADVPLIGAPTPWPI